MKNLFLLLISVFIISCQADKKSEVAILKDSVMAIHDEVMPKMGELMKTSKSLKSLADSIGVLDSTVASGLVKVASDIDLANDNMYQWMRSYEPDYQGTEEEILTYLKEQKIAIQKVKDDMNGTLKIGKEVLGNY